MGRWIVVLWLAAFAVQSAELLAFLAPDDCVAIAAGAGRNDPCPDNCARCVCCARTTAVPLPALSAPVAPAPAAVVTLPVTNSPSSAHPLDILHVPKTR